VDVGQDDLAVGVEPIFDHIMKESNHSPRLIASKLGGDSQARVHNSEFSRLT